MTGAATPVVDEVAPAEAFEALKDNPSAAMVDVRTRAEWTFTGLPDLSEIGKQVWPVEWVEFPHMSQNPQFAEQVLASAGGKMPERLFLICRSGQRSMAAAHHLAALGAVHHCTNVAEGFEGGLDAEGHRGSVSGWKARGLPWRQS